MTKTITGATIVAGVTGFPVKHSLSPVIHNAWIAAAGLDAIYVPFAPPPGGFHGFAEGLRGGVIRGLNVTLPFKEAALALADKPSARATSAGAANVLVFEADGSIHADNTDGQGLLAAFEGHVENFDPTAGPVVILGAGGAARGAVAAFAAAGAPEIRIVNRTHGRAEGLARMTPTAHAFGLDEAQTALSGAALLINATSVGLDDEAELDLPWAVLPAKAVAMDMVYGRRTEFLEAAEARGLKTIDGLDMLIGQAIPSFEHFFGQPPPAEVDVRALALAHLEKTA
jgi:shikimate dehydrogenase